MSIQNVSRFIFMMYMFFFAITIATAEEQDHIQMLSELINMNPNDAATYQERGDAYFRKGELDKAMLDYNKTLELKPDSALVYFNRGDLYATKGDNTQAVSDYSKAIEYFPNYIDAYRRRAELYRKMGETEKAEQDIGKIKEIESSDEYKKDLGSVGEDFKKALGI